MDEPAEIREWRTLFNDPVLTRLVHGTYEQNRSLRATCLRVIQARATRGITAGLLPVGTGNRCGCYRR